MSDIRLAARQWATRPDDERFTSLEDLAAAVTRRQERSVVFDLPLPQLADRIAATDSDGDVVLSLDSRTKAAFEHWAFGQACQRAAVPAGYLRRLPASLATLNLQWCMKHPPEAYDVATRVMVAAPGDGRGRGSVRAFTSTTYGRIWDLDVVQAVMQANSGGNWTIPAASYAATDPRRATTLYASDRDVWLFLVDVTRPIEVPGEGPLFRGFIVWNSEVGKTTFGLMAFVYQRVCDNRIIWGADDIASLRIRHTSGGPGRFIREAVPALQAYVEGSDRSLVAGIEAAKRVVVAESQEDAQQWLESKGFSRIAARLGLGLAEQDGRATDRLSLWDAQWAMTRYAQGISHTDGRVEVEQQAGRLLDGVAL